MKKSPLKKSKKKLSKKSKNPVSECKDRIQDLLRALAIKIYGGCVLRHFPVAGACSGYKKDGTLILQAEHLVSRTRSISYGDMRNIVCLCRGHHGFWKPQNSRLYWKLIAEHIGKKRMDWIDRVEADNKAYPMSLQDWLKIEIALFKE